MYRISNEIINICDSKIELKELDLETSENIKLLIYKNYLDKNRKGNWMWEKLKVYESLRDSNGWKYIKEFISNNSCIIFFNQDEEKKMFRIENGADLYYILSETSGFEFYITDLECTYLICFNHHDILFGCGKAMRWILRIKSREIN